MKKYTNASNFMATVVFKDFTQFLKRGESVETDSEVVKVPESVVITKVKSSKKKG